MSARRSDALIAKLGESLAKPSSSQQLTVTGAAAAQPEKELAAKISISLYADDLTHVDAIIAYMAQHRCRVNRSEAIKLALRGVRLTPELVAIREAIQRDDGRRQKSREK